MFTSIGCRILPVEKVYTPNGIRIIQVGMLHSMWKNSMQTWSYIHSFIHTKNYSTSLPCGHNSICKPILLHAASSTEAVILRCFNSFSVLDGIVNSEIVFEQILLNMKTRKSFSFHLKNGKKNLQMFIIFIFYIFILLVYKFEMLWNIFPCWMHVNMSTLLSISILP